MVITLKTNRKNCKGAINSGNDVNDVYDVVFYPFKSHPHTFPYPRWAITWESLKLNFNLLPELTHVI